MSRARGAAGNSAAPCGAAESRRETARFQPLIGSGRWNVLCCATGHHMLDREKIVTVLKRRFPAAAVGQVAAAANAIVGLEDEWEELPLAPDGSAPDRLLPCRNTCYLWASLQRDGGIRIFRKRS